MQNQITIGDKVQMPAFIDCFGNHVHETEVLTVTEVRLVWQLAAMKPYFRVVAYADNGFNYHEGAERFFVRV